MSDLAPHLSWAEVLLGSEWASPLAAPAPLVSAEVEAMLLAAGWKAPTTGRAPPPDLVAAMKETARLLWTPLREAWGAPLGVVSGLRSQAANKAAGGARASQHLLGTALDLAPEDRGECWRLYDLIEVMQDAGEIPKGWVCLYRHGTPSSPGSHRFCHVDRRGHRPPGGPRVDGRRTSFSKRRLALA